MYIIQTIISVLTAFLVYLITLELDALGVYKKQVASLAYSLVIFCPFLWFFVRMLYSEVLTTFLVTLLILLIIYALKKERLWLYFTAGFTTGLALLTRPSIALFPFFLVLLMILAKAKNDKFSPLFSKISVYLIALMLIWSPWIIRNYIVFKKFIPLCSFSGSYLYLGASPPNRYDKDFPMDKTEFGAYLKKDSNELLALDKGYKEKALKRIKEKPLTYIKYGFQRIPIIWFSSFSHYLNLDVSFSQLSVELRRKITEKQNFTKELTFIFIKLLLSFINILYVFTGLLGFILLFRYWRKCYPLLLIPLYFTLAHMFLGQASARYAIPAWPIFLIFSAVGLLSFYRWWKSVFFKG